MMLVVVIVDVSVDVDIVVGCGSAEVDVASGVVAIGDVCIMVVISDFFGARMTNFKTRDSVTTKIAKANKDMPMILTQRWRHHLYGPLFSGANLM